MNHQHFGRQGLVQPNPRIAPKLLENPVDRNNPGQGSYRSSNHLSMDKLANSLSPEYSEFQSKYYSESLPKRFDTNNYSAKEFKELAKDPRVDGVKYDRVSIDETRTIVQAKLENRVIEPTRPDMETARRVDLDYKVQGPAPFTHFDVKNPVGSVVHLYNFENIRNRNEIPLLMQAVLNGAEYAGYTDGILFLNYQ